uniref:Transmembrane protein n=1 Tax=Timema genevievae TaxID=629358 RepID=A0A7R9PQL4_TIMGE|nr:unnamed protein product [Timema genevievae]
MFISSLTLTAVVLACVSFFVVRASTTTPTNGTASSLHPHPSSAKKHPPSAASGLKIKNFIATDALYDGEQEKRIHYNGVTAKETSVSAGPMDGNMRNLSTLDLTCKRAIETCQRLSSLVRELQKPVNVLSSLVRELQKPVNA